MMQITTRKFLSYTLLPQFGPRLRGLMSGFTFIAFFLAQIYRAVGLLPQGHPYLSPGNIGRFGISHVVSEAGLILKKNKAPLDQKIVYWSLMIGIVVLAAQFMLMIGGAFVTAAHAADPDLGDIISQPGKWFVTNDPSDDIAFMMLDRVFGLKDMFKSCVSINAPCFPNSIAPNDYYSDSTHTGTTNGFFPTPYHLALHSAMQLYSVALLVIAAIILTYFIGAVIAETAQSGTPFGNRFNKTWAPLRLVVALGLLIPIANGLNAAQYITLYAAKFGSGFATNGWNMFVDTAITGDNTILGDKNTLVAVTNPPPITTLFSFMALVGACKALTEKESDIQGDNPPIRIKPYLINPNHTSQTSQAVDGGPYKEEADWDYDTALKYSDGGNIVVRFGEYRDVTAASNTQNGNGFSSAAASGNDSNSSSNPAYTTSTSNINPTCGEITIPVTNTDKDYAPGALRIMQDYYAYLGLMYSEATGGAASGGGGSFGQGSTGTNDSPLYQTGQAVLCELAGMTKCPVVTADQIISRRNMYQQKIQEDITDGIEQQKNSQSFVNMATQLKQYGWAGAGIWYNKIAQVNSTLVAAAYDLPQVTHMPLVMETIQKDNQAKNPNTNGTDRFRPHASNGQLINPGTTRDDQIGKGMVSAYDLWSDNFSQEAVSDNAIVNVINAVFGTSGLFDMSKNQAQSINPLAQLVAIGRGILESAKTNLLAAAVTGLGGGVINFLSKTGIGNIGIAISGVAWSIAMLGLSIGIVLTYVLPFLPFIYFFFAVGNWVKAIFEAMVGVPLWALAHLRISGEGLPGDAAMGGYFLILEIFLRPILIIFGMLGGMVIFVAQATVLNDIWPLVTSNLVGFDRTNASTGDSTGALRYLRDAIDQLFFSGVYAIVIYMLGMASFKMVDQVPNAVLRWIGSRERGFADEHGAAEHLMGTTWGGLQQGGRLAEGMGASPAAIGKAISGKRG